ncbi:Protein kinase [Blastocladiella emersonii ATCC 22665]|nr:Protein kinase [Blastocladiella emersonii ATCC 22665]
MASIKARVGHYEVIETLGTGSFGKVKLAQHVYTGHRVALKFINKAKLAREDGMAARVEREIEYLRFLRHPHIIKLYEVLATPTDLVMVMEYAGDELFHYIAERGRMAEDEARRFLQQLLSAVEYCHRHRIVHRDLKPENLLLDARRHLKVADFGLSNTLHDGNFLNTSCGSPNYAAPEVIAGKLYAGPEVDVWSCGVILYVMLVGRLPFDDDYIPSLFQKISGGVFSIPPFVSPDARSLLLAMLVVDPLRRISIPEIRRHPFFVRNLPAYLNPLPPIPTSAAAAGMPGLLPATTVAAATANGSTANGDQYLDDDAAAIEEEPLDEEVVDELAAKLGIPRDVVIARLVANEDEDDDDPMDTSAPGEPPHHPRHVRRGDPLEETDPIRVAYALCVDNRFLWSGRRSENALRETAWTAASSPPPATGAATAGPPPGAVADTPPVVSNVHVLQRGSPSLTGDPVPAPQQPPAPRRVARSKWHVGIRSRSPPLDVMLELYKALHAVGLAWKPLGPFALRARYTFPVPESAPPGSPQVTVKLDIQLFKVDTAYYLVDFKLVPAPATTGSAGGSPHSSAGGIGSGSAASSFVPSTLGTTFNGGRSLAGSLANGGGTGSSLPYGSSLGSSIGGGGVASSLPASSSARPVVRRRSSAMFRAQAANDDRVVNVFGFLEVAVRVITELASSG